MNLLPPTLIVIAGPTAVGKTEASIRLAEYFQTEIISCDSRQFYQEISIGTAKPSHAELARVPHHFINSHSISETVDAGTFEQLALRKLDELFKSHRYVIMTGGSGLYIQAVCEGLDEVSFRDDELRKELAAKPITELQAQLNSLDPEYYKEVDIQNPQRLMRAIEVSILSEKPYSSSRSGEKKKRPFRILKLALNTDRERLYDRINQRVDHMMKAGLLEEATSVIGQRHAYALRTVGYAELYDYIDGKISLERATELIKQNSRRYAKRQLTWLRRDSDFRWFEADDLEGMKWFIEQ